MFLPNGKEKRVMVDAKGVYSKWLNKGQHQFDSAAYTRTVPLAGSTGPLVLELNDCFQGPTGPGKVLKMKKWLSVLKVLIFRQCGTEKFVWPAH